MSLVLIPVLFMSVFLRIHQCAVVIVVTHLFICRGQSEGISSRNRAVAAVVECSYDKVIGLALIGTSEIHRCLFYSRVIYGSHKFSCPGLRIIGIYVIPTDGYLFIDL